MTTERQRKTPAERATEKLGVRERATRKVRDKLAQACDAVIALEEELTAEQRRLAYALADPDVPTAERARVRDAMLPTTLDTGDEVREAPSTDAEPATPAPEGP